MKFALFYEIPVARPWTPGKRAPGLQEHARAGRARRPDGLPRVLDGRAPLPRGVLALLEPRGALRRGRGAHQEHPHRLRRAPAAEAVQPPDPHRGVGRGARPDLRRPGRLRHRALVDARRARGLRHRPRRDARAVARGARATSSSAWTERRVPGRRQALEDGRARAACSRSRCSKPHPPIFGATQQPAAATRRSGTRASGCARSRWGCRPSSSAERIAHVPQGAGRVHQAGRASSSTTPRRRSRWCTARPPARRPPRSPRSRFEWYPEYGGGLIASVAEWQEERGVTGTDLGTYQYTGDMLQARSATACIEPPHHRLPARLRLRGDGRPRRVHRVGEAVRGGRLRPAALPGEPATRSRTRRSCSRSS